MQVKELLNGIKTESELAQNLNITGLCIDSRRVRAGDAYICLNGTVVDGHDYATEAVRKGASLVVSERPLNIEVPNVVVADTREAVGKIASNFYHHPRDRFKLIGITGTNGKTTTTYMVKNILECAGEKVGLIGTLGAMIGEEHLDSHLTTPDPIELHEIFYKMAKAGVDTVVMEVSAHAIALKKMSGVVCDVGVLTNVTQDHLDFFGSFENYANTKSRFIKPDFCKIGIVNADDKIGERLVIASENCKRKNYKIVSYGLKNPADNFATNIKYDMNGTHYFFNLNDNLLCINTRLIGEFNVYNALAAASTTYALGVDLGAIKLGLNSMDFVPGRINVIKLKNGASVVIDYAHTPDGLENILRSVRQITTGKLISVFGCGGNRDRGKRPVMGEISAKLADYTVLTSDNPRLEPPEDIIADIEAGIPKSHEYISIPDRAEAIRHTLAHLKKGDVAVIAGKGAEDYLDIGGKKIPYSDYDTVREAESKILKQGEQCKQF